MNADLLAQLRRLEAQRPRTKHGALLLLDDVETLRRQLVATREATGRDLARLKLNLDAARVYARAKGRTQ